MCPGAAESALTRTAGSMGTRIGRTAAGTGIELPVPAAVGIALVGVSGIVALPGLAEPYLLPKAATAALGVSLMLAAPRVWALPRPLAAVVAAAAVALGLAAATSVAPISAAMGRYPRYEGLWVLTVYVCAVAAGARMRAWPKAWLILHRTLALAALLVVLAALVQLAGAGTALRVTSLLGNASELGAWSAVVAAGLAGAALKRQPTAVLGFAAAGLAVVLSGSRGALLGLAVGLAFVGVVSLRRPSVTSRSHGRAAFAALVAVAALAALIPATRQRLLGEGLAASTVSGRGWLWRDTVDLIAAHPVLGVGPSGFVDGIGAFHSTGWAAAVGPVNPPDSPHNILLQILVSGGMLLLGACIAFGVLWVRECRRSADADFAGTLSAVAAVVAGVVSMGTHFTSAATVPLIAVLVGWVAGQPVSRTLSTGSAESWRLRMARWTPTVAAASAGLVLVTAAAAELPVARALSATSAGAPQLAEAYWRQARLLRPWDVDLWMRQGHAMGYAVTYGLAPAPLCLLPTHEAERRLPRSSQVAEDRVRCLDANGQFEAAQSTGSRALAHDPTNVNLLLLSGVVAVHESDLPLAEERFSQAAGLRPSSPEPLTNLAIVYDAMGRGADAAAARERARELEGDAPIPSSS